jgi:hypothetical protein
LEDIIVEGDSITVTSAEGENVTKYGLQVIDGKNNLVPLLTLNASGAYMGTTASEPLFFEVTAEDNITRITYQLEFIPDEEEAYVWSDLYHVDQEKRIVSQIPAAVNVSTLFTNLKANTGSGIKLLDRAGIERWQGPVDFEDYVLVNSADSSKEKFYQLNFMGEDLGLDAYITSGIFNINQETFMIDSVLLNTPVDFFLDRALDFNLGTGLPLLPLPARLRLGERILALAATAALLGRPGPSLVAAAYSSS